MEKQESKSKKKAANVFYDLSIQGQLCRILFVRSESLRPDHTLKLHLLKGDEFVLLF